MFRSRNPEEIKKITEISDSPNDGPVLMMNLNRYVSEADFPNGTLYADYMSAVNTLLGQVGGKFLWQMPVYGRPVGEQKLDEILAAWYPSHRAFLSLTEMPGSEENFRLRNLCVEYAVIHRCPGNMLE